MPRLSSPWFALRWPAYSSNLTFELETGWAFVETEDWRKDLDASWTDIESDNGEYNGIYLWMSGSEFLYFFSNLSRWLDIHK